MSTGRLEAFSDGVIAILITIMVLELKTPEGSSWHNLAPMRPFLLAYVLSFLYLGIYWNNHHHLLHAAKHVTGSVLWANLHLLFWLSLIPFVTRWVGEFPEASEPAAIYGGVLLAAGAAYWILQRALIRAEGPDSLLAKAIGRDLKGNLSPVLYVFGIALAFVESWMAEAMYAAVALMWLVPDRRIERRLKA
jgi:uncharacterized membrane protein